LGCHPLVSFPFDRRARSLRLYHLTFIRRAFATFPAPSFFFSHTRLVIPFVHDLFFSRSIRINNYSCRPSSDSASPPLYRPVLSSPPLLLLFYRSLFALFFPPNQPHPFPRLRLIVPLCPARNFLFFRTHFDDGYPPPPSPPPPQCRPFPLLGLPVVIFPFCSVRPFLPNAPFGFFHLRPTCSFFSI